MNIILERGVRLKVLLLSLVWVDGDMILTTFPQPQYPTRAADRGIQGYCVVEFTVEKDGSTSNHRVIENARLMQDGSFKVGAGSVFNTASLRAASDLKYKPKIVNGKPVAVENYVYKFTFQLEN